MACYNGPNPVQDPEERMAIWSWAKSNAIDHGLPFEKVHDMINDHFFNGMGRAEWINDILSGRKTPYRQFALDVWQKQNYRKAAVAQAQQQVKFNNQTKLGAALRFLTDLPRTAELMGHYAALGMTHPGDLAFRPESWGTLFRGILNTWTKSLNAGEVERLMDTVQRNPRFGLAVQGGLDFKADPGTFSGRQSLARMIPGLKQLDEASERAMGILGVTRFELWNKMMDRFDKPELSDAERRDLATNMAEWANHATGSAKGRIAQLGGDVLFGPKLTQSKLNRLIADPIKTVKTFANWNNATYGEKAAAWTRLSGAAQYLATGAVALAVNQGFLTATGSKDKINYKDPFGRDFLSFKVGGTEFSIPGLHSEIKTLAQILAVTFKDSKMVQSLAPDANKHGNAVNILGQYAMNKASPLIHTGAELITGKSAIGERMPWTGVSAKGKQPLGWDDYLLSHGPIPLQGPIKYVYDQMKQQGASALDASAITKAMIMFGGGLLGLHVKAEHDQEAAKRAQVGQALSRRH